MRVLIQHVIKTWLQHMFAKAWFYDVVKMKFPFGMCNSKRLFQHKWPLLGTFCQHSTKRIFEKGAAIPCV